MSIAKSKSQIPLAAQGFVIALCAAPIMIPFAYAGQLGRGENAWLVIMIVAAVVRIHWDLRGHLWFWSAVAVISALHIPVILFAPWTNQKHMGIELAPLILVDFTLVYGFVALTDLAMRRK